MKTRNILFLMTVLSSLLISCGSQGDNQEPDEGETSAEQSSKQGSKEKSSSSLPSFADLDHVKIFVSKEKNANAYNHIYAYQDNQSIVGNWPGAILTTYDEDWLTYDFDKKYTQFSIILYDSTNNQQTDKAGMPINGKGAYWYYNDDLEENDTMPNIHQDEDQGDDEEQGGGSDTPTNNEYGNIFHAFDWSLNAIKNKLNDISAAGYTAVQTSPLQAPKDYWGDSKNNDWWKLYQPWSFSVPSSNTYLGTRNDLKSLTAAAHKKDIKVIVDVVANHVGGNGDSPDGGVMSEIKDNASQTLRHEGQCYDWGDRYKVTHYRIGGYPELNSANTTVQNIVYKYLTELIDDGVDGFRFDAAKHIETPYDKDSIKSDFWTNTAVKARTYAAKNNKTLYMYGEILDDLGGDAKYDYYTTDLLDGITDNRTGNNILSAVQNGNSNGAANANYDTRMSPEKLVVWGESHDTYMNTDGSSKDSSQTNVDKAYALVASRKGARGLYFARPDWGAKLGSGQVQNENYKNKLISSVNKLKNDMGNNNDKVSSSGSLAIVERFGSSGYGATVVNVSGSGKTDVTLSNLPDGSYKDLVTGTEYTLKDHKVSININGSFGAAVLEKLP